jgi:hypothetical protein
MESWNGGMMGEIEKRNDGMVEEWNDGVMK